MNKTEWKHIINKFLSSLYYTALSRGRVTHFLLAMKTYSPPQKIPRRGRKAHVLYSFPSNYHIPILRFWSWLCASHRLLTLFSHLHSYLPVVFDFFSPFQLSWPMDNNCYETWFDAKNMDTFESTNRGWQLKYGNWQVVSQIGICIWNARCLKVFKMWTKDLPNNFRDLDKDCT